MRGSTIYDPIVQTHGELLVALDLAARELRGMMPTPQRILLREICRRVLWKAKAAAVAAGISRMRGDG